MPLNINLQQILLHLFNFVVLFAILYFLLYKPVKKFMDAREEQYRQMDEQSKARLAEAEQAKAEHEAALAAVEEEIAHEKEAARRAMAEAEQATLSAARAQAAHIVEDARKNMESERAGMLHAVQNEISDLVSAAAEKLAVSAGTPELYDSFLDTVKRSEADE